MNRQEWIDQWIARNRATCVDPEFVDRVMSRVATSHHKPSLVVSFLESLAAIGLRRINAFQSRPALVTTGAFGGILRIAVFLYVLLFV